MKQRLIDANAYAAELWKLRREYQMLDDTHTADKIMHGIFRAEQALKDAPTIDAVPVVRCRECQWYCANNDYDDYYDGYCVKNDICVEEDFFCADGDREKEQ